MLKSPLPAKTRRTAGAVLVATLSLGAACAAWAAAPTRAAISNPDWIAKPNGEDIQRLYPAQARKQGVTGKVLMTCWIDGVGKLQSCIVNDVAVTGENLPVGPNADMGFGAATLKLGPLFQMKPMSKDGEKTAGRPIRIPVLWRLPEVKS
jgi:hypothetical protein